MEIAKQKVSAILHSTGFTVTLWREKLFTLLRYGKGKSIIHALLCAEPDFISEKAAARKRYLDIVQLLVNKAENCDFYDYDKRTVLHYASLRKWIQIVQLLLEKGADPNSIDEDGNTPLFLYYRSASREVVDLLIDYGADVSCSNHENETLLHLAARNGWPDMVQSLIKNGADPNVTSQWGETPLCFAVEKSHKDAVAMLVKSGADVNLYNRVSETPHRGIPQSAIQIAADVGCLEIVQFLLDNGADPNDATTAGYTPLHFGVTYKDVVALLLDRGANVNSCTKNMWTSLHFAAEIGCPEIVQLLVENGADPSATVDNKFLEICLWDNMHTTPNDKFTPLHIAVLNSHIEVVSLFMDLGGNIYSLVSEGWTTLHLAAATNCPKMVQFLLEKGVNPNATANDNLTPLHIAVVKSNIKIAALLINAGANVNSYTSEHKWTPLHFAAMKDVPKMVKFLIKKGADPYAFTEEGDMSLHIAVLNSCKQVVSLLISLGLNVNICNDDDWTPLHYAADSGCLELVQLLVEKGANLDAKDFEGFPPLSIACEQNIEPLLEETFIKKNPFIKKNHIGVIEYLVEAKNIKDGRSETPLNYIIRNHPNLKLVKMFLRRGGYFTFVDFCKLLRKPELKKDILQNIEICTSSIVNKFNEDDLPKLYKLPMSAGSLPLKKHMLIRKQAMIQDIKESVKNEIEIKGYCNIIKPRMLLRIMAVRSYINYFAGCKKMEKCIEKIAKKRLQLKRSFTSHSNAQLCSPNKICRVIFVNSDGCDWM